MAEDLAGFLEVQTGNTSSSIIEELAGRILGPEDSENVSLFMNACEYIEKNKEMFRPALIAIGDELTGKSGDTLIARQAGLATVIIGARRRKEVETWLERGIPTAIVKIEREGCPADNYDMHDFTWNPMWVIQNDGTYFDLLNKVKAVSGEIKEWLAA